MWPLVLVREGESRSALITKPGRGMDFEKTLKLTNNPTVPARQWRRLVAGSWEPNRYDLRLTRLKAAPKESAERERSGWKLEYTRGEELVARNKGGTHQNDCKRFKIVVPG